MANYTQKAILHTFEEMLEAMPFDKITVSAIVAKCQISSNTFYYHFRDIYDLLNVWLDTKKEYFAAETRGAEDWAELLKLVFHTMQESPEIAYHISNSISRERLERYVFTSVEQRLYEYIRQSTENRNIPDETVRELTQFCCYSLIGYFLKFLWVNMNMDVDTSIDTLKKFLQGAVEQVLSPDRNG